VAAKSILDHHVNLLKRGVEVDHLLRQASDKVGGQLLAGHHRVLGVGSRDCAGRDAGCLACVAILQPCLQTGGADAAQRSRGLVAGEQDQRGLVVAVVERPLERRKVLAESLAKPVDRAGAVGAKWSGTEFR
jgi:hypothetical protein